MHAPSATEAQGNTDICKHQLPEAHDIMQLAQLVVAVVTHPKLTILDGAFCSKFCSSKCVM